MTAEKPDAATLEAHRTEVHPPRETPYVPDNVEYDIKLVYGCADGRDLDADLFYPKERPETLKPAIVFLHGGCWLRGSPSQFHYHSGQLASRFGCVAMTVDYRLSGEAQFPAALSDAKCAVRYLRSRAKELSIDSGKIAICGGSAGGHLSSMMLTTAGVAEYEGNAGHHDFSSRVNLGIIFNGEFDMWDLVDKGALIGAMEQFVGGTPKEIPKLYNDLSSVNRIRNDVPPTLFLHGTVDKCVSHEQSVVFHKRMLACGLHSELELYEGKPHAWFNKEPDRSITYERMERFMVEQLSMERIDG